MAYATCAWNCKQRSAANDVTWGFQCTCAIWKPQSDVSQTQYVFQTGSSPIRNSQQSNDDAGSDSVWKRCVEWTKAARKACLQEKSEYWKKDCIANPAARVRHYTWTISTSTQNTSIWSLTAAVPSDGVFRALYINWITYLLTISKRSRQPRQRVYSQYTARQLFTGSTRLQPVHGTSALYWINASWASTRHVSSLLDQRVLSQYTARQLFTGSTRLQPVHSTSSEEECCLQQEVNSRNCSQVHEYFCWISNCCSPGLTKPCNRLQKNTVSAQNIIRQNRYLLRQDIRHHQPQWNWDSSCNGWRQNSYHSQWTIFLGAGLQKSVTGVSNSDWQQRSGKARLFIPHGKTSQQNTATTDKDISWRCNRNICHITAATTDKDISSWHCNPNICDAIYQNQAYVGNAYSRERASLLVQGWKCRYWDFNTFEK